MKRTNLSPELQQLLSHAQYVTIATVCADGQPWNTPVVGRFDDSLNLYWVSGKSSRHSQNIERDPRIFVVVYDSTAPEGAGLGLYMQMRAKTLNAKRQLVDASKWYDTSFFRLASGALPTFVGDCPSRIYKATPRRLWQNVDGRVCGHFVDKRQEITL